MGLHPTRGIAMWVSVTLLSGLCIGMWYIVLSNLSTAKLISFHDVIMAMTLARPLKRDIEKYDFIHVTSGAVFLTLLLLVWACCYVHTLIH